MFTLFYDFETSGLNQFNDDVIEIGIKCLEDNHEFSCLVKPLSGNSISEKITKITSITNSMLEEEGEQCKDAFMKLFNFIKNYYDIDQDLILIAHNGMGFDDIFLKRMNRYLVGEEIHTYDEMVHNIQFVDSLLVVKSLYNGLYSYSMYNLCKFFNIKNESAHRAMGDVNALELIWKELIKMLKHKQIEISGKSLQYITYQ